MKKQAPTWWGPLLLSLTVIGCFAGGAGAPYQGDRDHLGWDELREFESYDAYYAVQRLRSHWFNARRAGSVLVSPQNTGAGQIQIYVDGIHQPGGPEVLRGFPVGDISEITHLNSSDATTIYGTDHTGGAILVQTKGDLPLPG